MRYLVFIIALFAALQTNAQNNIVYGAGINYTNGAPTFTPPVRTSRVAIDTVTGRWYHFNTPGGWQLIGNTIEEIAGCTAPAYTPGKGDSKVVINNCSPQPELYFYNGSAWVLVGGGSVYAGEGIRIENDTIILDSLYILRFRTGSNTDGAAGAMSWNATEETVDLVTDQGAVTGHLMESAYYNTRNTTGSSIVVGTVVMANGTTGNTGRILIAPAIANGTVNSEYILGLAAQTIGNNSNGKVQHFGKIRGIQTNGANYGETWVDGDVLYCSAVTPGHLTKVLPTAPNLKVPIAIVIHAHPSNGTLFVRPSHFPDLAQINDVELSSPTNGQVLTYNSTLSRWENATPANQLQTLSTGINTLTLSDGGGTVTVDTNPGDDVTGSGASGQVSFWTGSQTQSGDNGLFWDNSLKDLGIGTNAPSSTLDVIGNVEFQNPTTSFDAATIGPELLTTGTGTNWAGTGYSTGYLHTIGSTDPLTSAFTPVATNYYVVVVTVSGRTTGSISFTFGTNSGTTILSNTTQTNYWVAGSTGKLIITPTNDFNGTVVASVKLITASTSQFTGRSSTGSIVYEERINGSNIVQGLRAGEYNTIGINNVFIGTDAGRYNTTGQGNVFLGLSTGLNNATGSNNTFVGREAGILNNTGASNTFFGSFAGYSNVSGSNNSLLGNQAGYSNISGSGNSIFGVQAMFNATTSTDNTVFGFRAGFSNTTGNSNVFIGTSAGRFFGSASDPATVLINSIMLGADSRPLANSQSNQIVIGHASRGLGSNTTVIGNSSTTQTWLGGSLTLGTQVAPAARLHVVGSGTSSSTWTAQFHNSAGNNNALMIRDDGNVGVGTSSPGVKFEIRGNTSDNLANSFRVTNSNTQSLFDVRNDGQVTLGIGNSWFNYVDGVFTPNPLGRLLSLRFSASGATGTGYGLLIANGQVVNRDFTTGSGGGLRLAEGFAPTSGTGIYNAIQVDGVINQTGGANGVTRGLNIDHTLTSASNYRAVEWSNSSGFGLYGSGTAPNLLNGRLLIPSGTYDLPALSFVGDANTGIFRPIEDNIEIKTGTNNAIVIENQATNLKTNSENLTLSSPLNQNITVTVPGTITAPDGTLTANLAVPNTTLNQHRFGFLINMTTPSTISIYAKAAGYNFLSLGEGGSVSGENIIFNLSNGTFSGSSTNYTAQMESVGNGWYRCILTNTTTGAAANLYRFIIVRNANNTAAYTGDGTSGVYLWGFQAEESGSATSYIKTGSSTFLRPQAVSVLGPNLYGTLIAKTLAAPSMQDLYLSTQNTTRLTVASSGSVGIGTTTPNASAAFEVASTTQGVLFPRMTTTQRNAIATPADGLVIYNTTDNKLQVRAAGAWVDLH